jgi:HEAT repeat protein
MEVSVAGGRLSVNLRDAPLADVLRLVGQEARVKVNLDGQFLAPITGTFTGLPLESGIRRLTRGHSSSFAYGPPLDSGQAPRLIEIWVIESEPAISADPRARAARLASLDNLGRRTDDAAVAELTRILAQDPDPAVRTRAAGILSRSRDARATPALTTALGDQQSSVRIQAVHGLRRLEGERATEALGRVLLNDPDPSVRRVAAWALTSLRDAAAGSALRAAMSTDGDASVRQAATAAYRRWELGARPPAR